MIQENNDVAKQVFMEETFPLAQDHKGGILNESFDEQEFQDKEQVLSNVKKFWKLPSLTQKKYAKNFPLILEKIGKENLIQLVDSIYIDDVNILEDNFEVCRLLINNIKGIFLFENSSEIQTEKDIQDTIEKKFIDFLDQIITSQKRTLSHGAKTLLQENNKYFSQENFNTGLIKIIIKLLHGDDKEQNQIIGLNLISYMYKGFNEEYFEGFILNDIYAKMLNTNDNVRFSSFKTFFSLIEDVQIPEKMMIDKFLVILSKIDDDSNTDIKLIHQENIAKLSRTLSFYQFDKIIFEKYLKNLKSKSRFIKEEALKNLGQLIDALISKKSGDLQNILDSANFKKSLDIYYQMPQHVKKLNMFSKKKILENNLKYLHDIMKIKSQEGDNFGKFQKLLDQIEGLDRFCAERAKNSIAQQFHLIVQYINTKNLDKFLRTIQKNFLILQPKTSVKVIQSTLQVLSGVLEYIPPFEREKYADNYAQISMDTQKTKQWRFRYVIAEQFEKLSQIFRIETIHQKFIPLFINLCRDECSIVRKKACKNFYSVIKNCQEDEMVTQVIFANILAFSNYSRFVFRQSFLYIMEGILLNIPKIVNDELIDALKLCAKDKVINNRICLARVLLQCKNKNQIYDWEDQIFEDIIKDPDFDLLYILKEVYVNDEKKKDIVEKQIQQLEEQKKSEIEKERSFIISQKSETESDSEDSKRLSSMKQFLPQEIKKSTSLTSKQRLIGSKKNEGEKHYDQIVQNLIDEYQFKQFFNNVQNSNQITLFIKKKKIKKFTLRNLKIFKCQIKRIKIILEKVIRQELNFQKFIKESKTQNEFNIIKFKSLSNT